MVSTFNFANFYLCIIYYNVARLALCQSILGLSMCIGVRITSTKTTPDVRMRYERFRVTITTPLRQ